MYPRYTDIIDRIDEPPKWYTQHGVPRYCDFSPKTRSDVYAKEIALVAIQCQACHKSFLVEMSLSITDVGPSLLKRASTFNLYYGDPPRHDYLGECSAGDSMSSDTIRVVELWVRKRYGGTIVPYDEELGDWVKVDVDRLAQESMMAERDG